MAYSTTKRSLCKACNKIPSVFFCQGCQMDFCTNHAKEHRQELSKQLDTIIIEHDQLKQNLAECMGQSKHHPLIEKIDQWERESIDKIHKAANDARKQLSKVAATDTTTVAKDLNQLTQELIAARSENNFIEIDLKEWMEKLEKWTKDLITPSSISIQQEKYGTPFIQKIVVIVKEIEFFEKFAGKLKIEDNGQVIISESADYSTARCHSNFSSEEHKFRFKIEQSSPNNWMYFGIVSQNVPLQKVACYTPTNFGWSTNNIVWLNGSATRGYNGYVNDMIENDIVELFLDCDRRKICLTNETTNTKHELAVNINQCPFPWQVHIGFHYQNDRVRYLSE